MSQPLSIAINAEFHPRIKAGGTQSVVLGLVRALGELSGPEHYQVIVHPENRAWIEPAIGANTELVNHAEKLPMSIRQRVADRIGRIVRDLDSTHRAWTPPPLSDGFYEGLGCRAIHFPFQHFVVCGLPSIFNPHDLLHLHYPQFFSPAEIASREAIYPTACRLASKVVTGSQWIKGDLCSRYGLDSSRIQVIPWAPPTQAVGSPPADPAGHVEKQFGIRGDYTLYPAVTWEHKNHLRLLEALASVRNETGRAIQLVCTGHKAQPHWDQVENTIKRLGLQSQVHFLGLVSISDLRALYRSASFVIVPTLFEAASGPVFEAWEECTAVACSNVTSLPEQAGDAALIFDPFDVAAIARALVRLATEPDLRQKLRDAGQRRLGDFSWERTARAFRAVYRQAAGVSLDTADRDLLQWDWMRDPRRERQTT